MFIFNLTPFPLKMSPVCYSWMAQIALSRFEAQDICLLGSELQLIPPTQQNHGPWVKEFFAEAVESLDSKFEQVAKLCVPDQIINNVVNEYESPLELFKHSVNDGFQSYKDWLLKEFSSLKAEGKNIEGIITWINDRSIEDVGRWLNIPVIHMEAGNLREPACRLGTFYFDYKGVNGHTEASERRSAALANTELTKEFVSREELLKIVFTKDTLSQLVPSEFNVYEAGIPLQVEDDSNVIVYSHGTSLLDILYRVIRIFPPDNIIVRDHPAAHFGIVDRSHINGLSFRFGMLDASATSLQFAWRCKRIFTLNSSVGLESLLLGKATWIFGDSPFAFMGNDKVDRHMMSGLKNPDELENNLNWYIFGYLVPRNFWMNPEYIRWRLSKPTEIEIFRRHKAEWDAATVS